MTYFSQRFTIRFTLIIIIWAILNSPLVHIINSTFFMFETSLFVILLTLYLTRIFFVSQEQQPKKHKFESHHLFFMIYFLLTCFFPNLFVFFPVMLLEYSFKNIPSFIVAFFLIVQGFILGYDLFFIIFLLGLSLISHSLDQLIVDLKSFSAESFSKIDRLRQFNTQIQKEQNTLLQLQDQRIEISKNQERKRIVNEIHDLLGHQISSSVIQLAGLQLITEDETVKNQLQAVQEVLNESMNNIRKVIHSERQETNNLELELSTLVNGFIKCPIHYHYENHSPLTNQAVHNIVNTVKEALTNIIKHSNASRVTLRFMEHSKEWSLLIIDNGDQISLDHSNSGIGLLNIEERVQRLNGSIHISRENGFRIFIRIPKGGNLYEDSSH